MPAPKINGPMVAAASINNVAIAALLLDCGAAIDGAGSWSPLEEALYWNNRETIDCCSHAALQYITCASQRPWDASI